MMKARYPLLAAVVTAGTAFASTLTGAVPRAEVRVRTPAPSTTGNRVAARASGLGRAMPKLAAGAPLTDPTDTLHGGATAHADANTNSVHWRIAGD